MKKLLSIIILMFGMSPVIHMYGAYQQLPDTTAFDDLKSRFERYKTKGAFLSDFEAQLENAKIILPKLIYIPESEKKLFLADLTKYVEELKKGFNAVENILQVSSKITEIIGDKRASTREKKARLLALRDKLNALPATQKVKLRVSEYEDAFKKISDQLIQEAKREGIIGGAAAPAALTDNQKEDIAALNRISERFESYKTKGGFLSDFEDQLQNAHEVLNGLKFIDKSLKEPILDKITEYVEQLQRGFDATAQRVQVTDKINAIMNDRYASFAVKKERLDVLEKELRALSKEQKERLRFREFQKAAKTVNDALAEERKSAIPGGAPLPTATAIPVAPAAAAPAAPGWLTATQQFVAEESKSLGNPDVEDIIDVISLLSLSSRDVDSFKKVYVDKDSRNQNVERWKKKAATYEANMQWALNVLNIFKNIETKQGIGKVKELAGIISKMRGNIAKRETWTNIIDDVRKQSPELADYLRGLFNVYDRQGKFAEFAPVIPVKKEGLISVKVKTPLAPVELVDIFAKNKDNEKVLRDVSLPRNATIAEFKVELAKDLGISSDAIETPGVADKDIAYDVYLDSDAIVYTIHTHPEGTAAITPQAPGGAVVHVPSAPAERVNVIAKDLKTITTISIEIPDDATIAQFKVELAKQLRIASDTMIQLVPDYKDTDLAYPIAYRESFIGYTINPRPGAAAAPAAPAKAVARPGPEVKGAAAPTTINVEATNSRKKGEKYQFNMPITATIRDLKLKIGRNTHTDPDLITIAGASDEDRITHNELGEYNFIIHTAPAASGGPRAAAAAPEEIKKAASKEIDIMLADAGSQITYEIKVAPETTIDNLEANLRALVQPKIIPEGIIKIERERGVKTVQEATEKGSGLIVFKVTEATLAPPAAAPRAPGGAAAPAAPTELVDIFARSNATGDLRSVKIPRNATIAQFRVTLASDLGVPSDTIHTPGVEDTKIAYDFVMSEGEIRYIIRTRPGGAAAAPAAPRPGSEVKGAAAAAAGDVVRVVSAGVATRIGVIRDDLTHVNEDVYGFDRDNNVYGIFDGNGKTRKVLIDIATMESPDQGERRARETEGMFEPRDVADSARARLMPVMLRAGANLDPVKAEMQSLHTDLLINSQGNGTTVAMAHIFGKQVATVNLGDSPIAVYKKDGTFVELYKDTGTSGIIGSLGDFSPAKIHAQVANLTPDDAFLVLMSDGVTKTLINPSIYPIHEALQLSLKKGVFEPTLDPKLKNDPSSEASRLRAEERKKRFAVQAPLIKNQVPIAAQAAFDALNKQAAHVHPIIKKIFPTARAMITFIEDKYNATVADPLYGGPGDEGIPSRLNFILKGYLDNLDTLGQVGDLVRKYLAENGNNAQKAATSLINHIYAINKATYEANPRLPKYDEATAIVVVFGK